MDSLRSLGNLPPRKMRSGAAALIRRSGSILDIATAFRSRSNSAIDFVNQHRVVSLMEVLSRTANSCKAGLVVGALRIACMVCARPPDSILLRKTQDAFWSVTMRSIAFGITIDVPPVSILYVPSGLAPANAYHVRRSSMTYCSKMMSEATGFASLLPSFLTRSSQLITCKEPTLAPVSTSVSLCMGESK